MSEILNLYHIIAPWIAALVAYIGGLRLCLWAVDHVEESLPNKVRSLGNQWLFKWWQETKQSTSPLVIEREAKNFIEWLKSKLDDNDDFKLLVFLWSFIFSLAASLLRAGIGFIAELSNYKITSILVASGLNDFSINYDWSAFILLNSTALWLSIKTIKDDRDRLLNIFTIITWYLFTDFTYTVLYFFYFSYDTEFLNPFTYSAILSVFVLTIFTGFDKKKLSIGFGTGTIFLLVVSILFIGWPMGFAILSATLFFFIILLNFVGDWLTVKATQGILVKIPKVRQPIQVILIFVDVLIAFFLSMAIYIGINALYSFFSFPLNGSYFQQLYQGIVLDVGHLQVSILLFSFSITIPTIVFWILIILRYLSKFSYWLTGKTITYLMFEPRPSDERGPIYLTLSLVALLVSIVPAHIAFLTANSYLSGN